MVPSQDFLPNNKDMGNLTTLIYTAVLFVLLTPGILFTAKGSKLMVAIIHGALFALILSVTHKLVYRLTIERFTPITSSANIINACVNGTSGANGTCLTCYSGYRLNDENLCVPLL